MSWTDKQKALAVRACKDAHINTEQRELILRQLGGRAVVGERATSTSGALTNADFNQFMAIVEQYSGGQIKTRGRGGKLLYRVGHWQLQQQDNTRLQLIYVAGRISGSLLAEGVTIEQVLGTLGQALGRSVDDLDLKDVDEAEARKIVHALRAVAMRHNITLNAGVPA